MYTNPKTGWVVAGILAVILLILIGFMIKMQNDRENNLGYVLEKGGTNISSIRGEIALRCGGADPYAQADCAATLEELSDILAEFSKDLEKFTPTTTPSTTKP